MTLKAHSSLRLAHTFQTANVTFVICPDSHAIRFVPCRWQHYFNDLAARIQNGSLLPLPHEGNSPSITFKLIKPHGDNDVKAKRMRLAMHGLEGNQSLYMDYCFAGMKPDWLGAGLGALSSMFDGEVAALPDYVVFNMAAWWRDTGQGEGKLYESLGQMYEHGRSLAALHGSNTTFLWRDGMVKDWERRNKQLRSLALAQQWQVLDTLPLYTAMTRQRLWLNMRRTDGESGL